MRQIIITDNEKNEIKIEREGVDGASVTFMLAAALILFSRRAGLTEERLNSAMSGLWEEESVVEAEE